MAVLNDARSHLYSLAHRFWSWQALLCALLAGAFNTQAQTAPSREYQIKAVFLFNFTQFVNWPPDAFTNTNAPMVIGILGNDPFGPYLDETVRDEKAGGHPLVVQRYDKVDDVTNCQILFISSSENRRLEHILAALKDRSILTVGDMDDFSRRGGIIRFATQDNKIRLRINLEAARARNLTISSRLLGLADIVRQGED